MSSDTRPKTLRVVLFVLVTIVSLTFLYMLVFRVDFGGAPSIKARFSAVGTINVGSPVRKSGIKIGTVKMMEIDAVDQRSVTVTISLYSGQIVRESDRISIASGGILGDQYIEVIPGDPSARVRSSGEVVEGVKGLDLGTLAAQGGVVLGDIATSARIVAQFLQRNEKSLDRIVQNLDTITSNAAEISQSTKEMLATLKPSFASIVADLQGSLKNLHATSENVQSIARNFDDGFSDVLKNKENAAAIEDSIKNVQSITKAWKSISDTLQKSFQ